MQPIPIGLIGVGRHGGRYFHHLTSCHTGFKLVAFSRNNVEKGRQLAKEHSLHFYANWEELLADSSIPAIIIVTPVFLHLPVILEAIKRKKAILVEKPLAMNSPQGRQIVKAAAEADVPLMTAQTLRYEPTIQKLQEIKHLIGSVQYFSGTMRLETFLPKPAMIPSATTQDPSVGIVLELGVHLFDLTRFLVNDEVQWVKADLIRSSPHTPEHRAWIRLGTRKGIEGYLEIARVPKGRNTRMELIGAEGQALGDWTKGEAVTLQGGNQSTILHCTSQPTLIPLLKDFCRALLQGSPVPISGQDGLRTLEIADACYQSSKTGQAVTLSISNTEE